MSRATLTGANLRRRAIILPPASNAIIRAEPAA